jgi:hypothetical protein
MGHCNIKFGNQEDILQKQQDNRSNNRRVEEQVGNSKVKFGTLEDLNNSSRGAMSRSSCFLLAVEYDAEASLKLISTLASSATMH